MSEKDIQLLVMCLKEYIKNIDGERFKQLFFLQVAEYTGTKLWAGLFD